MAANFKEDKKCVDCGKKSGAMYNVKEKQMLCDGCVEKKDFAIKTGKEDKKWFCEKHAKAIKFYCDSHDLGICQSCAIVRHGQPCVLHDLDDIVTVRKTALRDLVVMATKKTAELGNLEEHTKQQEFDATNHLKSVEREIGLFFEEKLRREDATLRREEDVIKQEAEEEISKINEKKEERLLQSRNKVRAKREKIAKVQEELLISLTDICNECTRKFEHCHHEITESQFAMRKVLSDIETLLLSNRRLIEGGKDLVRSLNLAVGSADERKDKENPEGISSKVKTVRFVKSEEGKGYKGRVDWCGGKWKISDSIEIPEEVDFPMIAGCINEEEVVISDWSSFKVQTYVTNIRSKKTEKVIQNDSETCIASCTLLDDNTIVCGKGRRGCSGPVLTKCISLYDRQWQLLRHLDIPRDRQTDYARVEVAVDVNGKLLACEAGPSIFVIDSKSGKIESVITCKSENMIRMRGVMTCGKIVAIRRLIVFTYSLDGTTLFVIDRQGDQMRIKHSDTIWNVAIDPLTDDPYVVCYDAESNVCSIDRMSYNGEAGIRELSLPLCEGLDTRNEGLCHVVLSGLILTSDGKLILCDGRNIMIYKKKFTL
ncbi:uncharacterized protein [Diadema antillarum]|uniref:uncharacterized protein n=1 Tax=Diadema antillarum TaxID=105358 RepID=UPI003A867639